MPPVEPTAGSRPWARSSIRVGTHRIAVDAASDRGAIAEAAVREAVADALAPGEPQIDRDDVAIVAVDGAVDIGLRGHVAELATATGVIDTSVSVTDHGDEIAAVVVLILHGARPTQEVRFPAIDGGLG